MRRNTMVVLAAGLLLLSAAAWGQYTEPVLAPPVVPASYLGPTGAILTPSASTSDRTWTATYHGVVDTWDQIWGLNVSLVNRFEIGVSNISPSGPGSDMFLINGKVLFVQEDQKTPAIGVGVVDLNDELDRAWYIAATKTFGKDIPITLTLGAANGDVLLDGVFGSAGFRFVDKVDALAEWDSQNFNFGLRIYPYNRVALDLSSIDTGGEREFGFGASYTHDF